jgi:hypothetical protein
MTASARMPPGVMSVSITDPARGPYAILTKTKVSPADDGYELHFLRRASEDDWLGLRRRLEGSGAYSIVRLVSLGLAVDPRKPQ